jgi:SAM-dependent methyltransferase
MSDPTAREVREVAAAQYHASTSRLQARATMHQRFSTATQDWWPWVHDHLALRPDDVVVEVGAGTGALWGSFGGRTPAGMRVLLTDASPAMCATLASLRGPDRWIIQSDAQQIPLPDATADVVIANHMLYHVPDIDRALADMSRVLVRGGRLVVTTNGGRHMSQLEELADSVGIPYGGARLHSPFRLEDAPARIGAVFTDVHVASYDDTLLVTDAEAVVDYLASVATLDATQREALRTATDERIRSDGAFRIDKTVGLITASSYVT